jgi:hypothetical protein
MNFFKELDKLTEIKIGRFFLFIEISTILYLLFIVDLEFIMYSVFAVLVVSGMLMLGESKKDSDFIYSLIPVLFFAFLSFTGTFLFLKEIFAPKVFDEIDDIIYISFGILAIKILVYLLNQKE